MLLLLAACGDDGGKTNPPPDAPPPDPDEGVHSGTRIQAQWRTYGDAPNQTRSAAGLYDSQLGIACTPSAWTDGNTYCTPTASAAVFSDSNCMQPVGTAVHRTGCTLPAPSYFVTTDVVGCASQTSHLYQVGTKIASPTPFYQHDSVTGECSGPFPASANLDYYTVGAEVAPSSLAALTRAPGKTPDAGRIQRRYWTTSDGAATFATPYDSMLDIDCTPVNTIDATTVTCAPASTTASYFHDGMCKVGELAINQACTKPTYASQATMPGCPTSPLTYFRTGDATTAPPIYTSLACTSTTAPAQSSFYLLGDSLAVASLARSHDATSGRTVQLIHSTSGSTSLRDLLLYDTQHGVECQETPQLDGTTRCLPRSGNVSSFFTDMGCTAAIQVLQVSVGGTGCTAPAAPTMITRSIAPMPPDTCGTTFQVYDVGALYTDTLYTGTPPACAAADTTGFQNYVLGAQHAPTEFPLGTLVRDP